MYVLYIGVRKTTSGHDCDCATDRGPKTSGMYGYAPWLALGQGPRTAEPPIDKLHACTIHVVAVTGPWLSNSTGGLNL